MGESPPDLGFVRVVLVKYLDRLEGPRHDHEDLASEALIRLLEAQESGRVVSQAQAIAYSKVVVDRLLIDARKRAEYRKTRGLVGGSEDFEDPAPSFVDRVHETLERVELERVADQVWLGSEATHHQLRLAAAKLIYSEGRSPGWVCQSLATYLGESHKSDPILLLSWVSTPAILRNVVYSDVHKEPDRIVGYLHTKAGSLSSFETEVVTLRYRAMLSPSRVNDRIPGKAQEVEAVLNVAERNLPFEPSFRSLADRLQQLGFLKVLHADKLPWKRITFQYLLYDCRHEDIANWFGPLAAIVDVKLNRTRLHSWIYMGTLAHEIRRHRGSHE